MGYGWDFGPVFERWPQILRATGMTLQVMLATVGLAVVLGLVAGQMRLSRHVIVRLPATIYVDFFRTTPLLVQLVWIFFGFPLFLNVSVDPFEAGVIALSLNYGAFLAEIFRAGITSLPRGQLEAALALGMSNFDAMRRVIYPQALRAMLPPIGGMLAALLKDTSLVSVIGVTELMNQSQNIGAITYRAMEPLTVAAVIYFLLNYPIVRWADTMHRRGVART